VTDNILEGVSRRTVIELLESDIGVEVVERSIDRTELLIADEAFFTGTGVQVAAITRIDHRNLGDGTMGPVTRRLRDAFFDAVRGRNPAYRRWCVPALLEANAPAG
jgi:branched-chain amino acid aminotransferase